MSNYFSYFPTTQQNYDEFGNFTILTNILKRYKLTTKLKDDITSFHDYEITTGDRPDILAEKYYGSSDFAWLILLFNDIQDPIFDWPLFDSDFENYVKSKYGSISEALRINDHPDNKDDSDFKEAYEYRMILTSGDVLDDGTIIKERYVVVDWNTFWYGDQTRTYKAISEYEYETELNESKRIIKILNKVYLNQIRDEVKGILRGKIQ